MASLAITFLLVPQLLRQSVSAESIVRWWWVLAPITLARCLQMAQSSAGVIIITDSSATERTSIPSFRLPSAILPLRWQSVMEPFTLAQCLLIARSSAGEALAFLAMVLSM